MSIGFAITGDPVEIDRFSGMMLWKVTVPEDCFFERTGKIIDAFAFAGIIPMPAEAAKTKYEEWAIAQWNSK